MTTKIDEETFLLLNEQVKVAKMFIKEIENNKEILNNKVFMTLFTSFIKNSITRINVDSSLISLPMLIVRSNKDHMNLNPMAIIKKSTIKCIHFQNNIFDYALSANEMKKLGITDELHFPVFNKITFDDLVNFVNLGKKNDIKQIFESNEFCYLVEELKTWMSLFEKLIFKKQSGKNIEDYEEEMSLFLSFYNKLKRCFNSKFVPNTTFGKIYLEEKTFIQYSLKKINYEKEIKPKGAYLVHENEKVNIKLSDDIFIVLSNPDGEPKFKKNKLKFIKKDYSFLFNLTMILESQREY
jgi:hypothetical protein